MTRVVAHVDRLVLKGLRVADPASFGSTIQGELAKELTKIAPTDLGHHQAPVLRTEPVRFERTAGDAHIARAVARKIARVLRS